MNLNYWEEHSKLARVIFTGIANDKFERERIKYDQKQECMVFVGPLQSDVFDELLQLHPVLKTPDIKEEVKKFTNCVPREVMQLVKYIDLLKITITNVSCFRQVLKKFEDDRVAEIVLLAQKYYNVLQTNEKIRYYESLTRLTHYLPLYPYAQRALLKMYLSFDLPKIVKYQLRVEQLDENQFEEVLFRQLVCRLTQQYNLTQRI
ncbi:hypothetical protein C1646_122007 [Rhizophagus diaphanus]|nr:hypothetical protein C1646_122007 [Rhizophagus diaphanus] [Rhizophagus sp. MUCL 43196]